MVYRQLSYSHFSYAVNLYLVHILSPVIDNCPSREIMTVEIISRSISTKVLWLGLGSNPGLQNKNLLRYLLRCWARNVQLAYGDAYFVLEYQRMFRRQLHTFIQSGDFSVICEAIQTRPFRFERWSNWLSDFISSSRKYQCNHLIKRRSRFIPRRYYIEIFFLQNWTKRQFWSYTKFQLCPLSFHSPRLFYFT